MSSASTTVVVGVSGGIAAYKSCELIRALKSEHFEVHVIPTLNALRFVGEATLSALSGNKVLTDVWQEAQDVHHISLAKSADVIAVYPATADFLARLVEGRANDLLTATLLSSKAPKILFPAMHTEMWLNDATQTNVKILRERGYLVVLPESGQLTSGDAGIGRLSDPASAAALIMHAKEPFDLAGVHVLITAGGTREDIDPVRYISNKSSGKQGFALAQAAAARGATVTLIGVNTQLSLPSGVTFESVTTGSELKDVISKYQDAADVIIMAAAVSDYVPTHPSTQKIKKSQNPELSIQLKQSEDILAHLVTTKSPKQVLVGFAAETGVDALTRGVEKIIAKGCNVAVANDVSNSGVFNEDVNQVMIRTDAGVDSVSEKASKISVAHRVLDSIQLYRKGRK